MTRFNLAGAIALVVVAAAYLVASLVSGHSAASHPPVDLTATDQALGPYRVAALLIEPSKQVMIIDTRTRGQFEAYHLPASVHLPNASPKQVLRAMDNKPTAIIVAASDNAASELVGSVRPTASDKTLYYAQGGAQAFYLTFELPVAAFTEKPAPFGYHESVAKVRRFVHDGSGDPAAARQALEKLSTLEYAPTQLAGKKPKAATQRKKISGGCG